MIPTSLLNEYLKKSYDVDSLENAIVYGNVNCKPKLLDLI